MPAPEADSCAAAIPTCPHGARSAHARSQTWPGSLTQVNLRVTPRCVSALCCCHCVVSATVLSLLSAVEFSVRGAWRLGLVGRLVNHAWPSPSFPPSLPPSLPPPRMEPLLVRDLPAYETRELCSRIVHDFFDQASGSRPFHQTVCILVCLLDRFTGPDYIRLFQSYFIRPFCALWFWL